MAPLDVGTAEVALAISGVMCAIGVLNYRATRRERELARIEDEHRRELETREWRTETRATLGAVSGDVRTVKTEQREMREEIRANADHIRELSVRHDADVAELSGRIERVDGRVGDLMSVMQGDAEIETGDVQEEEK